MSDIIELSKENYVPQLAIIVYSTESKKHYLEMHKIDKDGKMRQGSPLTEKCIAELVANFSVEQSKLPHGTVPDNMLFCDLRVGHEKYIWYNPPQQRQMYFVTGLGIENGTYHVPGVVYLVSEGSMNIYAYKGRRLNLNTKLCNAPFFNVTGSSVCLGSSNLEYPDSPSFNQMIGYWEKKFWLTEFSHLGGSQNPTKDNLVTVTKQSTESFDEKQLITTNQTVNNLLR